MRRDDSARRRFVDRQRPAVPLENGANEGQAHAVAVAAAWLGGAEPRPLDSSRAVGRYFNTTKTSRR